MDELQPLMMMPLNLSSLARGLSFALTTLPFLACSFVVCVAVHRLYFHPLRSLPGPLLGRLSSLYNTFHIIKKDEARNLHNLHQRYGPVVRYGPHHVSFRSPEAVRTLYTNSRFTRKADSYLAFPRNPENASLFSVIDKQVHARKRRLMRHGFTEAALRDAEVTVRKHVAMLCRCLEFLDGDDGEGRATEGRVSGDSGGGWSAPKNYAVWINRYSFDLSSDLSLSLSFDMMASAKERHLVDVIHENMWEENITGSAITVLHKWGLRKLLLSRLVRSYAPFDDFVRRAAEDRLRRKVEGSDEGEKDFTFWLTRSDVKKTEEDTSLDELMEEIILLITAGGDTSSTVICAAMYHLLHNHVKLARLQREVRAAFPTLESISAGPALQSCTYLRACIDEALRMAPPAGSVLRREVQPGGVVVGDIPFPEGTNIGVPIFSLQHDETFFPEPFTFQPERWIPGEVLSDSETVVTPETVKRASAAFLPFSAGTRNCIGRPLALMQMQILYATLVWKYDIRLCPDRWVNGTRSGDGPDPTTEYELQDIFTSLKNGPLIQVRARA